MFQLRDTFADKFLRVIPHILGLSLRLRQIFWRSVVQFICGLCFSGAERTVYPKYYIIT